MQKINNTAKLTYHHVVVNIGVPKNMLTPNKSNKPLHILSVIPVPYGHILSNIHPASPNTNGNTNPLIRLIYLSIENSTFSFVDIFNPEYFPFIVNVIP